MLANGIAMVIVCVSAPLNLMCYMNPWFSFALLIIATNPSRAPSQSRCYASFKRHKRH